MLSPTYYDVSTVADCLSQFPPGPLDEYRKRSSFDWRKMKLALEGEDVIKFKFEVWSKLQSDPLFHRTPWEELSRHEQRRITSLRLRRLLEFQFTSENDYLANPYLVPAFVQAMGQYSWSLALKRMLGVEYFALSAKAGYSKSDEIMNEVTNFKAVGALSITEMAHGSNTKKLQTTATFDPKTQEFLLNTPNLEATKVWSGALAQTATHAIVFAQLYTPDNICHGLHSFMVPVRNLQNLHIYKGVTIGDMGGKLGLNGVDNGFMSFSNYRVPKSSLMGHSATVTEDGRYISRVKDKSKRLGYTLGVLSTGRIFITLMSLTNLQTALCIAVRYSAVRKQFGPSKEELPVLEYQSQHWRLLRYIAASYVMQNFFGSLFRDYVDFVAQAVTASLDYQIRIGAEIHSLSSCGKAISSWLTRDGIQECRECCGGHGYLQAARFGELRDDHDANTTYEGDNNVLLQQTSNYLLKFYKEKVEDNQTISSPFQSVDYLNDFQNILQSHMKLDFDNINNIIEAFNFLVCYLLRESDIKYKRELIKNNNDQFTAKNETQIFHFRTLAIAYGESEAIKRFAKYCKDPELPMDLKVILDKLGLLYALWTLEKYESILYEAGFFQTNMKPTSSIQKIIIGLCDDLKNESVSLVDAYAPPDYVLNSCLGYSNGHIYENIFDAMIHSKQSLQTPDWFYEVTEKGIHDQLLSTYKSKL